ncbi:hypothetical protein [Candidatus Desulfovibrio trichonymphae]|uniref:hypothetical protein n=1 Tax=Candidatus Desulfovibrio trichonymphae TaxID=1725232 RepID=UPI001E44AF11|nr:hypothetical protein [Candidatus Desulfovibrio trichonymphae]
MRTKTRHDDASLVIAAVMARQPYAIRFFKSRPLPQETAVKTKNVATIGPASKYKGQA